MTTSNSLTNDELLGISNLPSELISTDIKPKKPNRNYYKLTPEILLSKRGLPNLISNLDKFKFLKRSSKVLKSGKINKFNKIGSEHHYQNLTNLLHVYQSWGHSIYPKYKFKDFIKMLGRNSEFIECKNFLKDRIRNEMIEKRSKINNNGDEVTEQADVEVNVEANVDIVNLENNMQNNNNNNNDNNKINDSDNEEWPELFGGNSTTLETSKNLNAHLDSESESESESEELKINPTPKFSAILRTSSQPIPIQTENKNIALSDDEFAGNELQDFLSDLDEENEENENEKGNTTDKDITMGLSQHMAKDSANKIGNDDDDDDDDNDEFEILRSMIM